MLSTAILLLLIGCCIGEQTQDAALRQHAASARCPLGFIKYKSSCYLFSRSTATYFEAQSSCGYFGSRLAEINSKDEVDFIREYLKKNGEAANTYNNNGSVVRSFQLRAPYAKIEVALKMLITNGVNHYISGTDLRKEGIWTWENPVELVSYLNWSTGQPDNKRGNEHCLDLQAPYGYLMNDCACETKMRFVCEQNLLNFSE